MIPELFVFNMIGTTIEPSDAIPEAFRAALSTAGVRVSDLQAGVNAGVGWNFAVLTCAHSKECLSGVEGTILLESVAEPQEYCW